MNTNASISRRRFAQLLGIGAAATVAKPALNTFASTVEAANTGTNNVIEGVVRLSSNENPYGPSPKGLQAMTESFAAACRYPDKANDSLIDALAKLNGVDSKQILLGDGSGEILKLCASAFTGPAGSEGGGPLVAADPTFEAILGFAQVKGAKVVKIPLTSTYAHDLAAMGKAAEGGGLAYICNPNNPTASITPKSDLHDFISKTSPKTMILVDEAYFHYADSPEYESVIPLIKERPNLIVARTFSKIYGMAGLRCGYAVAQPNMIERMRKHQPWDSVNIMALSAALASLNDPEQVPNGQRLNQEARDLTINALTTMGYKQIPSQANFIMFDLRQPVVPIIQAMKQRNVEVGRLFPAMPNHMRLTIGKKAEMEAFLAAFKQVTAA